MVTILAGDGTTGQFVAHLQDTGNALRRSFTFKNCVKKHSIYGLFTKILQRIAYCFERYKS